MRTQLRLPLPERLCVSCAVRFKHPWESFHATLVAGFSAVASLQSDGSWSDIAYDGARSAWGNALHVNRILVMTKAAGVTRDGGRTDEAIEAKVLLALKRKRPAPREQGVCI